MDFDGFAGTNAQFPTLINIQKFNVHGMISGGFYNLLYTVCVPAIIPRFNAF